jgi:dsDNA-specific endonuclease/ATPase MutS2
MNTQKAIEFDLILTMLADQAMSETVREKCRALTPSLSETEAKRRMDETSQAKRIIEQTGAPLCPQ